MRIAKIHDLGAVTGFEAAIAPFGKPIKSVYLFKTGPILIDTGPSHLRQKIQTMVPKDKVNTILLTHHHEDHSGNAAALSRRCNAGIFLHPYGVAKLSKGFMILPYQHILFGKADRVNATACPTIVSAGNVELSAIHTPGHSKDHTVYYARNEGWLFTGDLYVGEKIRFFRVDEDINKQISSLEKVLELDFDTLFCSHRGRLTNGRTRIEKKCNYLKSFRENVQNLQQKGIGEGDIVKQLRVKNDTHLRLFTLGNISFLHMVRSALRAV